MTTADDEQNRIKIAAPETAAIAMAKLSCPFIFESIAIM